ncbi:MAG: hypothetical protein ABI837_01515, partial [Acidobacteriota bacterium]
MNTSTTRRAASSFAILALLLSMNVFAASVKRRLPVPGEGTQADGVVAPETAEQVFVAGFEAAAKTDDGRIQVMVELFDSPAAVVYAETMKGAPLTSRVSVELAAAATQAQVARIRSAQDSVSSAISGPRVGARELYRVQKALNGIAVAVDRTRVR